MACKCKVDKQIEALYKNYGVSYNGKKKRLFDNFSLWRTLVVLITLPIMLIVLLPFAFRSKPIKMNKLVRIHS